MNPSPIVMTRKLHADVITDEVAKLCMEANFDLGEDVLRALREALEKEESSIGKEILGLLMENAEIARTQRVPMCQDTGFAVVFLELGQDLSIVGGDLTEAINEGIRQGYREGYLRKSIVGHPFARVNTRDNTPAVIHTEIVPGDRLKITVAPKGGGSENMSTLAMLRPADGKEGVKRFVVRSVQEAGANACPPLVVGVGLGGTFEKAAYLSKKALIRRLGEGNTDPELHHLEEELLEEINNLGIGPLGFGGRVTALAVHIESYPCHITGLPVAVNLNCHAARHKEVTL